MSLSRPSSATGTFVGGAEFNTDGTNFAMKSVTGSYRAFSRTSDQTGDGDTAPCYGNSGYVQFAFSVQGFMVADDALGLASLDSVDDNPVESVTFNLSSNRSLVLTKAIFDRIVISYDYQAPDIGVQIQGRATGTLPSALEP